MVPTTPRKKRPIDRTRWLQFALAVAAGVFGVVLMTRGAEVRSPGEEAVRYRHAVYTAIAWNVAQMRAMLDGSRDYDAARFATAASHVKALAPLLAEAFPPDSNLPPKSAAKAEVWREWPDFERRLTKLATASESLAAAAADGDRDRVRRAFGDLTENCKSCHEHYKQAD
jgi:cytochrome c556